MTGGLGILAGLLGGAIPGLLAGAPKSAWSGTPAKQIGQATPQVGFNQYAQQGMQDLSQNPLWQQASQLIQNMLSPDYALQQQDLFQRGVADPSIRNYEQNILPRIKSSYYAPSGVYGSGLNKAITQSSNELSQGLDELRARYLMQGQNQQQNALSSALGFAQAPFQQNQQYYNTLFGAQSPIIQEAQSGWIMDLLKSLISSGGQAAKGYFSGGM